MALVSRKSELPLYGLLEVDSIDNTDRSSRLPLPPTYAIESLIPARVQMEIERFVRFAKQDKNGRAVKVALAMQFCEALNLFRETRVPTVYGVQTMPIDEGFGIYFAIEPELLEILPREHECTLEIAKKEFDWLCNEWLGDVATGLEGKTCAIAMAMTIIVRHVVKLMPFFLARAGQRGSGKTTLLNMIIMAVTGTLAPAAAWSPRAEERRKAVFSYMMRDLPALVLDNIERGTDIKCPHLSAYSTAGEISDRELGKSNAMTLPATTVVCFSGNSVNPGGDIASRTICIDLDAKRADPENRPFMHEDPITFTTNNRKRVLRALYTILCMQRAVPATANTRFKDWWRAVGHALELLTGVSFDSIMEENEAVDEEASASAQLFEALGEKFGYNNQFTARKVRRDLLDPDHGLSPFCVTDGERSLRTEKKEEVDDFRGMLEEASSGGRALPPGVPNALKIGHRLRALAGRTVEYNGQILQLQMEPTRDKINKFVVAILPIGTADEANTGRKPASNRPKKMRAKPTREEIHAAISAAMAEDAASAGTSH